MFYLLFIFYLLLLCIGVNRLSFIKNAHLGRNTTIALFLVKVVAGVFIGWISQHFYSQGNDYWNLNRDGWTEYQLLVKDPATFFSNIFYSPYEHKYGGFFDSNGSYWKDLSYNILIKLLAFLNILSRGNYYLNSLFFSVLGFIGHVAFYRVFADIYKNNKKAVLAGAFLLPSTLYFTSGIHKDTIVFLAIALFSFAYYFTVHYKVADLKKITVIVISLITLLLIRNFTFFALVPAAAAMLLAERLKFRPFLCFVIAYFTMFIIVISLPLFTLIDPLEIIVQKQKAFTELPVAVSQLPVINLKPEIASFIRSIPRAIDNGFFQPHVWKAKGFLLLISLELFFYLLLFLFYVIKRNRNIKINLPFIYFGIFFACTLFFFSGYIVPNAGSIARYRSLYLPFVIIPLLCNLENRKSKHIL